MNLELAAALCRQFEGYRAKPYLCPANVATIGYGSTYYADGRKVTLEDPPMDEPTAEHFSWQSFCTPTRPVRSGIAQTY